ncbi:hypothetical protein BGW42_007606 [Actinomortierella wolfii]|nr:hypothetical protein BGW42_007606 [Actinomortierella wolfii]
MTFTSLHNHPPSRLVHPTRLTLASALIYILAISSTTYGQTTSTPPPFNKHSLGAMAYTQSGGLFYIQGGEYGPGTANSECVVSQFFAFDLTQPWNDLGKPVYYNLPASDKGAVMNSYHVATHSLDNKKVYTLGWNSGAHRSCTTEPGSGDVFEGSGNVNRPSSLIMRYSASTGEWTPMPDGAAVPNSLTEGWRDFQGALSPISGRYLVLAGNAGVNGTEKRNQQLVLDTNKESVSVRPMASGAQPNNSSFSAGPARSGYGVAYVRGGRTPGWYVLGGRDVSNGQMSPFTSLDVLKDTDSMNEWAKETATGTPPSNRDRHCVASDDTRIFVYGGFANETATSGLYILDTTTMSWRQASNGGNSPSAVGYAACTVVGNQFLLWGGFTTPAGVPVLNPAGALKVYDISKDTWVSSYTPPSNYQNLRPVLPPGFTHPNDGKNGGNDPNNPGNGGGSNGGSGGGVNGAVIGGAVGGAVVVIGIAVAVFLFIRRRKRQDQQHELSKIANNNPASGTFRKINKDGTPDSLKQPQPPSPSAQQQQQQDNRLSTATSDHRLSKADASRFSAADSTLTGPEGEYVGPYYLPKLRKINRVSKEMPEIESPSSSKEDLSKLQLEEEAARRRMNEAEAASMTIPTPTDRRSRAQSEQFTAAPYASEYLLIPLADRNSVAGSVGAKRPQSSTSDLMFAPHNSMTPRWSMVVHPNSQSHQQLPTVPEAAMPVAVAMVPTSGTAYVDPASGSRLSGTPNSHLESRLLSWYGNGAATGYQPPPPLPPGAVTTVAAVAAGTPAVVQPGGSSPSTMSYESSIDPVSALTSGLTSFPDTSAPLSPIPPSYPPPPPLLYREGNRASPQFIPVDPNNPAASKAPVSPPFGAVPTTVVGAVQPQQQPSPPIASTQPIQTTTPMQGPVMTWAWPWPGVSGASTSATEAAMAAAAAAALGHPDLAHSQYTPHLTAVHLPPIESPLPSGSLPSQQLQLQAWDQAANYKVPRSTELPSVTDETASTATASSSPSHRVSGVPSQIASGAGGTAAAAATTITTGGGRMNFP